MKQRLNTEGFTLIELLLAMTVFTAVMVIATAGFIGMNRTFTRGMVRKSLSESVQQLNQDVTRSIRAQGQNANATLCGSDESVSCKLEDTGWSAVCLGEVRYLWQSDNTGMVKDGGNCLERATNGQKTAIFDDRFKVSRFNVEKVDGKAGLFRAYGTFTTSNTDALEFNADGTASCKGSAVNAAVGTCAVENFSFIVSARQSVDEEEL